MTTRKEMVRRIIKLRTQLREVENDLHNTPLEPVTGKQTKKALNVVLRVLDFDNRYKEGDLLRKAFGVELDAVAFHKEGK